MCCFAVFAIESTVVSSLSGVENASNLERLDIGWCPLIIDVTPLLDVTTLRMVVAADCVFCTEAAGVLGRHGVHLQREV